MDDSRADEIEKCPRCGATLVQIEVRSGGYWQTDKRDRSQEELQPDLVCVNGHTVSAASPRPFAPHMRPDT